MDMFSFKDEGEISFYECPACSKGELTEYGRVKIDAMLNRRDITSEHKDFERVITAIFKELYKGRWSKGQNPWQTKSMVNTAYISFEEGNTVGNELINHE